MPRLFGDYRTEVQHLQAWQQRQDRIQAIADSITPEDAVLISQYGRVAPLLPPGLVRSLSQAGVAPTSPIGQFAITQQQYRSMIERGRFDGDVSRRRSRPRLHADRLRGANSYVQSAIEQAREAGIINEDGVLVEPEHRKAPGSTEKESPESAAFNRLQRAFEAAHLDMPYVSNNGQPRMFKGAATDVDRRWGYESEPIDIEEAQPVSGSSSREYSSGGTFDRFIPDFLQQETEGVTPNIPQMQLEAAGIPIDPANPVAPLMPFVRTGFMALDAPIQEFQGQVRNIHAQFHGEGADYDSLQSDFGVMLGGHYGPNDAGSGWLVDPESAVARERRRREALRGQIGGHNITLGRWIADSVTEPDTTPFRIMSGLVDAAVQVADPSAFGMGKAGKIGTARRLFQPEEVAGIFSGVRRIYHGPTAQRFLDNHIPLINALAQTSDPYDIAKLTNFKLDPSLAASMAATPDTREIRRLITEAVDRGTIRRTTDLTGTFTTNYGPQSWANTVQTLTPKWEPRAIRLLQPMPAGVLDLSDQRQVANQLRNALNNAHASEDTVRSVYNSTANATTTGGLMTAIEGAMGDVGNLIRSYGTKNDELVDAFVSVSRGTRDTHLSGLGDEIGADRPVWEHVASDGSIQWVPGPHLISETMGRFVYLPDARAVRRLTSKYRRVFSKNTEEAIGQERLPITFVDWATSKVLKPMWLLRLAWPIRVIGEEQIRMATAGLDSAFSGHPLSWMSLVIGTKQGRMDRLLSHLPGLKNQSSTTLSGLIFEELEEFNKAVYNTHANWLDRPGAVALPNKTLFDRTIEDQLPDFRRAWASELATFHKDPVANYLVNHTLDETVDWMNNGEGMVYRTALSEQHPATVFDDAGTRRYLEMLSEDVRILTGGNTDLLDLLKSGEFRVADDIEPFLVGATNNVNPVIRNALDNYLDNAPQRIKGDRWSSKRFRSENGTKLDHALERMYSVLMGVPTAKLSRAPAFKQFYWKRTAELLPYADEATQQTVLANAAKAGLSKRTMSNLERAVARRHGDVGLEEMEDLVKGYALDDTKGLLYDISEKGQISDVLRNVVPFGEAWKEVMGRWGKLTLQTGGKTLRRGQQIIQGARGEDFGEVTGAPPGRGFFYTNEFGEEIYNYPGSQWLMNQEFGIPGTPFQLPGMPVPLTGRVQGLNMFGSILPSLGPVASVPLAWFLQDKPKYDWWKEQLMPFGGPGVEESATIIDLQEYLPAWGKTAVNWLLQGGNDDRVYNSSVMYVAAYLYSTGEYTNTIENQQRLMEDARNKTRDIYAIRALGQFMLPASPNPQWLIKDKSGRLMSTRILAEEFFAEVDQSRDYEQAVGNFMERYGEEAIGAIIPHSSDVIPGVVTSLEGAKWVAEHRDIKTDHPLVYALFAPRGDFHYETYVRNFITNERDALTPVQWQSLRDNALANYWYNQELARLGVDAASPNDDQARWLRGRREAIQQTYPHWGDNTGREQRPELEVLVREIYRAAADPRLVSTPEGQALNSYIAFRDQAVAMSREWSPTGSPNSFQRAQAFAPTRASLRRRGQQLIEQYPGFQLMWDLVFSRELLDEELEEVA